MIEFLFLLSVVLVVAKIMRFLNLLLICSTSSTVLIQGDLCERGSKKKKQGAQSGEQGCLIFVMWKLNDDVREPTQTKIGNIEKI